MYGLDNFQILFLLNAFVVQLILCMHFAMRKWNFTLALRYGWVVYGLSVPSILISFMILSAGKGWPFWLGGILYFIWAVFGYTVEYIKHIEWRNSLRWPILIPYVLLYLATMMFYWWPLAVIYKPLWYVYAVLFLVSTYLNVTSHKGQTNVAPAKT